MTHGAPIDTLPRLRHAARGCVNSIRLCVSALELPCTPEEELAFINDVIDSSDQLAELTETIEQFFAAQNGKSTR